MKKIKKILSLAMALAISSSMLTAVNASAAQADSHGDYYAVYPVYADGSVTWHGTQAPTAKQGASFPDDTVNGYHADTDSVIAYRGNGSDGRVEYFFPDNQGILPSTVKYVKQVFKYDFIDTSKNSVHWLFLFKTHRADMYEGDSTRTDASDWTSKIIELHSEDIGTYWFQDIFVFGNANTINKYAKYYAFFENEADAKAYDLSIKSYSINGIAGTVDNIAHTITFNDIGGYAADFENAQPVMVSDPLATIATESTINYEDDIVYNVTNVLGEQITYTVKFNYGEDIETPEGAFAIRYNSKKKVDGAVIESEYDDIVPTLTYDEENKAVKVDGLGGHDHERLFIRTPIANLSKYKYAKIKYMYDDGTGRETGKGGNTIGTGISFDKGEKGKTIRTGMYPDLIDGKRLYSKKWFTDIVDVSSLTMGRDSADGISFNALESSNPNTRQSLVLKIKYIALFENYADAVSYDSTDKFTAPAELEAVSGTLSVKTTVDYVEDYGNASLAIAVYKDGKLLDVAFSAAPTYTPDAAIDGSWLPWLEKEGSKQWCMTSELKTTLSTTLDVSDYEAGTYTAKVMMIGKDSVLPYCNAAEYTLTVAERNGQKQVRVTAVTEN